MQKALPTILSILCVLLLLAAVVLIGENASLLVTWRAAEQQISQQALAYPMACTAVLSGLAVAAFAWANTIRLQGQGKRTNRELERQNISSEAAENRIEILEGQVRTLEAALDKALLAKFPKND
jgi:TRAP-type C4-dicarboxylate transport system permease small subunit